MVFRDRKAASRCGLKIETGNQQADWKIKVVYGLNRKALFKIYESFLKDKGGNTFLIFWTILALLNPYKKLYIVCW